MPQVQVLSPRPGWTWTQSAFRAQFFFAFSPALKAGIFVAQTIRLSLDAIPHSGLSFSFAFSPALRRASFGANHTEPGPQRNRAQFFCLFARA